MNGPVNYKIADHFQIKIKHNSVYSDVSMDKEVHDNQNAWGTVNRLCAEVEWTLSVTSHLTSVNMFNGTT
jgi:hypothetical protein